MENKNRNGKSQKSGKLHQKCTNNKIHNYSSSLLPKHVISLLLYPFTLFLPLTMPRMEVEKTPLVRNPARIKVTEPPVLPRQTREDEPRNNADIGVEAISISSDNNLYPKS